MAIMFDISTLSNMEWKKSSYIVANTPPFDSHKKPVHRVHLEPSELLLLEFGVCVILYVLVMSCTPFRVNQHSVVA